MGGVPVLFTIHNLAFQGVVGRDALATLGLGWEVFNPEALEYWGNLSLLKGGVNFSEGIEKTIDWYLANPEWIEKIVSGEYRQYYSQMYDGR